ncbi:hypothetical protein BG011_003313 [Mortierella polycephala]|uniref:Kinesin motor domain-containing protein n=1 Tax=Mortierella polycephala TaxID=41804 RepID=A0A9P6Q5D5_9FUNG|nr:hypothetical protein BG011_003313 [Mortierella polycephala]
MAKQCKPSRLHRPQKQGSKPHTVSSSAASSHPSKRSHPRSLYLPPPKIYNTFPVSPPTSSLKTLHNFAGLPPIRAKPLSLSNKQFRSSPSKQPRSPGSFKVSTVSSKNAHRDQPRLSLSDLALPGSSVVSSVDSSSEADTTSTQQNQDHDPEMDPIKTFLRLRPPSSKSANENHDGCVAVVNDTDVVLAPPSNMRGKKSSMYKFTKVFGQRTSQSDLFDETCLPLLTRVLRQNNHNALIFAYGFSNSGKTHSIIGSDAPGQAGMLPRALAAIFKSMENSGMKSGDAAQYRPVGYQDVESVDDISLVEREHKKLIESIQAHDRRLAAFTGKLDIDLTKIKAADIGIPYVQLLDGMDYTVWLSCAEIYADKIYDLLMVSPESSTPILDAMDPKRPTLSMKTDASTGHKYVHGLKEIKVKTLEEAMLVLRAGLRQRQIFSTLVNKSSSRSHCIFTIKILKTPQFGNSAAEDAAKGKTSVSRLSIVDLAGSERARSTSSSGQRLKEASDINVSLMYLGQCIEILRLNQRNKSKAPQKVPYNHCKLTQLFQSALDGRSANSQIAMIVNINPSKDEFDETDRVLKFASVTVSPIAAKSLATTSDKLSMQRISSSFIPKPTSLTLNSRRSEESSENSDNRSQQNSEADNVISILQSQISDLQIKLEAAERQCSMIEAETRNEVMDTMNKVLSTYTQKESCSRGTSPIEVNQADIDMLSFNQCQRESSVIQGQRQAGAGAEAGELDLVKMQLKRSEASRRKLEQALEESLRSNEAWRAWFANAPINGVRAGYVNTPPPFTNDETAEAAHHHTRARSIVSIEDDDRLQDKPSNDTAADGGGTKAAEPAMELMEALHDVEEYAIKQASRNEDFIEQADFATNLSSEEQEGHRVEQDEEQDLTVEPDEDRMVREQDAVEQEDSQMKQVEEVQNKESSADKMVESDMVESDMVESDMMESDMVESGMVESGMVESGMVESDMVECDTVEDHPIEIISVEKLPEQESDTSSIFSENKDVQIESLDLYDERLCERLDADSKEDTSYGLPVIEHDNASAGDISVDDAANGPMPAAVTPSSTSAALTVVSDLNDRVLPTLVIEIPVRRNRHSLPVYSTQHDLKKRRVSGPTDGCIGYRMNEGEQDNEAKPFLAGLQDDRCSEEAPIKEDPVVGKISANLTDQEEGGDDVEIKAEDSIDLIWGNGQSSLSRHGEPIERDAVHLEESSLGSPSLAMKVDLIDDVSLQDKFTLERTVTAEETDTSQGPSNNKKKRKLRTCKAVFEEEMEEALLTKPAHSIINQSFDSRLRLDNRRPINGDGFGVDPELGVEPCIFTSVTPAWNNMNLIRIANKIKSPLVFAHVRASTAGSVSESHPWQYGRLMFMHNGNIANFHLIKRKVMESLSEEIFLNVNGNTDSEWAFAVFLNQLKTPHQSEPFCHNVLKEAMLNTIAKLNAWCKTAGITTASMMNFAVTDGVSVVCSRYISSRTLEAASLYYSSGTRFESYKPGHYRMVKASKREDLVVISSEPLTFEKADWLTIPTNTLMVVTSRMNVLLYPIVDEFYNSSLTREGEHPTIAVVKGENREDGVRDQEHREVAFVGDVCPTSAIEAVLDEFRLPNGSARTDGDSGDSAPSTPLLSSRSSSHFVSSSPSASSLSTLSSHMNDGSMDEYNKEYHGDYPDGTCIREEVDTEEEEDDDIEEDYRIFPARVLSAPVPIPTGSSRMSDADSSIKWPFSLV